MAANSDPDSSVVMVDEGIRPSVGPEFVAIIWR